MFGANPSWTGKLLLAAGLTLFATAGAFMARRISGPRPGMELEIIPPSREVAARPGESTVTATYTIVNRGKGVVTLGTPSTSCGCSVASISGQTIEPGVGVEVVVSGQPPSAGRKAVEIMIPIKSSEAKSVRLGLTMVGADRPPYLVLTSLSIPFGDVKARDLPREMGVMVMTREPAGQPSWIQKVDASTSSLRVEGGVCADEDRDLGGGDCPHLPVPRDSRKKGEAGRFSRNSVVLFREW